MVPLRNSALGIESSGKPTMPVAIRCGEFCGMVVSYFAEGLARLFVEGKLEVTRFVVCGKTPWVTCSNVGKWYQVGKSLVSAFWGKEV